MKTKLSSFLFVALAACGDDNTPTTGAECGAGTTLSGGECVADVVCGSGTTATGGECLPTMALTCGSGTMAMNGTCVADVTCGPDTIAMLGICVPVVPATNYVQVEHLGRPGINEALILSDAFLAGYNATAPTYAGVPTATLNQVIGEAKTVLRAVYLGACFLNGVAGLSPSTGVKPAGIECNAVGAALLESDGETQTAATITASNTYADTVFGLFIPDILRIDTANASAYQTLCPTGAPMALCGGRWLRDDTIDVTYDFLINGAATCATAADCQAPSQFNALVSDGVAFNTADAGGGGSTSRIQGDPSNNQQGHPEVSNTFPYSAAPI